MQHLGHAFASYLRALRFKPGGALLKFSVLNQTSHFNKHTAFLLSIKIKTASKYKFKIFFQFNSVVASRICIPFLFSNSTAFSEDAVLQLNYPRLVINYLHKLSCTHQNSTSQQVLH